MSLFDERFLMHRLRSTSLAGILASSLALVLFAWRFYVDHEVSWDLLAIGITFVVIKLVAMTWYRLKD